MHHIAFLFNIMKHRNQNMKFVSMKANKFFKKDRLSQVLKKSFFETGKRTTKVLFDEKTKTFFYVKRLLYKYGHKRLHIIPVAHPTLGAKIAPKRKVCGGKKMRPIVGSPLFWSSVIHIFSAACP